MSKGKSPFLPVALAVLAAGSAGFLWLQKGKAPAGGKNIAVYVVGEVNRPGVVSVPEGSRVVQAIERAGGLTGKADPLAINLAERLTDEQKVVVPPKAVKVDLPTVSGADVPPGQPMMVDPEESLPDPEAVTEEPAPPSYPPPPAPSSGDTWEGGEVLELPDPTDDQGSDLSVPEPGPAVVTGRKINLNSANVGELQGIPGVGPQLAAKIVGYRSGLKGGRFDAIEDLANIPGIKLKKLEQMRPYLTL